MDTAYQKWEKRRQERSGGQRRMARRRGSGAGVALGLRERRRLAQLAVCLALFLAVFVGKGIFPERLAEARETVLGVIQSDTDFQAAFSQLGRSVSQGEPILDTLGEHVADNYIAGKKKEWEEYRTRVSSWEREKYIINY